MENTKVTQNFNDLSIEEIDKLIEQTTKEIEKLNYELAEKCKNINSIIDDLENNNIN